MLICGYVSRGGEEVVVVGYSSLMIGMVRDLESVALSSVVPFSSTIGSCAMTKTMSALVSGKLIRFSLS